MDEDAAQTKPQDEPLVSEAVILIVDDEIGHLESLKLLFERAHLSSKQNKLAHSYRYKVHTASSGPIALEIIRNEPIDLVLTDLMMPQMKHYSMQIQDLLNMKMYSMTSKEQPIKMIR